MEYAVECIDLTKKWGSTVALNSVNLKLEKNKIYGLLGRNGAGKSTLLNILATHSIQSKGTVKIFNEEPYENSKILDRMCIVKESGSYLAQLKVKDILKIAANFYKNWDEVFAVELLKKFKIDIKKRYSQLSKGTQSALDIVIGLAARTELAIYDEPYLGLDAASRWLFYDILLKDYTDNPKTIILSTHLIDEVSKLFEKIIILDEGKVLLCEEAEYIRDRAMELSGSKDKLQEFIKDKKLIHLDTYGNSLTAVIFDEILIEEQEKLIKDQISIKPVSLQDFFVYMTTATSK